MEQTALEKIKEFVGEGGLVPFEHGYKKPRFNKDCYIYVVSMISDKVVYCRKRYQDGTSRSAGLPLSSLPERTLEKLYKSLKDYLAYCQTEA